MSVAPPGGKPTIDAHRPRRIGLRPCDARHGRQRGSARGQMQKLSAGKFHGVPSKECRNLHRPMPRRWQHRDCLRCGVSADQCRRWENQRRIGPFRNRSALLPNHRRRSGRQEPAARVPILLQKSAITMREDCLDLLTRLPTMPLLASGSAPTRDLAPLWLGKACIERWWRSSDQFCEAA